LIKAIIGTEKNVIRKPKIGKTTIPVIHFTSGDRPDTNKYIAAIGRVNPNASASKLIAHKGNVILSLSLNDDNLR